MTKNDLKAQVLTFVANHEEELDELAKKFELPDVDGEDFEFLIVTLGMLFFGGLVVFDRDQRRIMQAVAEQLALVGLTRLVADGVITRVRLP